MTRHPERAADYLEHILDAIDRAIGYAAQAETFETFAGNALLQDGIVRNIGIIGEAAVKLQQLAPQLVTEYPDIPWKAMQTMRHKLIHDYFDIDLEIVWSTVQRDLPGLAEKIRPLKEMGE